MPFHLAIDRKQKKGIEMGTETEIATVGKLIMVDSIVECMHVIKIIEGKREWVRYQLPH